MRIGNVKPGTVNSVRPQQDDWIYEIIPAGAGYYHESCDAAGTCNPGKDLMTRLPFTQEHGRIKVNYMTNSHHRRIPLVSAFVFSNSEIVRPVAIDSGLNEDQKYLIQGIQDRVHTRADVSPFCFPDPAWVFNRI